MRRLVLLLVVALAVVPSASAGSGASGWSVMRTPNPSAATAQLFSVSCVTRVACVAVGSHVERSGRGVALAERWDGRRWRVQRTPNPAPARVSILNGVSCVSARACLAVGEFFGGSGVHRPLVERWNGRNWRIVAAPRASRSESTSLFAVSCRVGGRCLAVGRSGSAAFAARWTGSRWISTNVPAPRGTQFSNLAGVSCVAPTSCVAVGDYVDSSGADLPLVLRWNSQRWRTQATSPLDGAQFAFLSGVSCVQASACVAVGGSDVGTLVLRWDGETWTRVASPSPAGAQFSGLFAIACATTQRACSAVGGYLTAEGAFLTLAEQWNGGAWRVVTSPNPEGEEGNFLAGVACPRAASCVAVGQLNGGGTPRAVAQRWNGSTWRDQRAVSPRGAEETQLNGVSCPRASRCVAVGVAGPTFGRLSPVVERWNGRAWRLERIPTARNSDLGGVSCPSVMSCVAVGGSESGTFGARWNGRRWRATHTRTPAGAQFAGLGGISCPRSSLCIATGFYAAASGRVLTLAERWDGSRWTIMPTPNDASATESYLGATSCASSSSCMAVGEQHFSPGLVQTLAEHWNGHRWTIERTANPKEGGALLGGVSCTRVSQCIAVGGSDDGTLAERWNGRRWQIQPTPMPSPGASFSSVACAAPAACTAVGFYFTDVGGTLLSERWNGRRWNVQPTPLLAGAHEMSPPAVACPTLLRCVAVGGYENDGPGSITLAERWTGRSVTRPTSRPASASSPNDASRSRPLAASSAVRSRQPSLLGGGIILPPALRHLTGPAFR
jgi:hypothetical protein